MIGIKPEGQTSYLQTKADTSIEITLENPLLGDVERLSPGSFSIPFDLPAEDDSPDNSAILKNPDVLENNEAYQLVKATLFYDDVPFKKGNFKSKKLSSGKTTNYFTFGLNTISEDFKTAKLRTLLNETIVIDSSPLIKEITITWLNPSTPVWNPLLTYTAASSAKVKFTNSSGVLGYFMCITDTLVGESPQTHVTKWQSITAEDYAAARSITVNGKQYSGTDGTAWETIKDDINLDGFAARDTGKAMPFATTSGFYDIVLKLAHWNDPSGVEDVTFDVTDPIEELSVRFDDKSKYTWSCNSFVSYYAGFQTFLNGYLTSTYATDKVRFPIVFNDDLFGGEAVRETNVINAVDAAGVVKNEPLFGLNYNSIQPFVRLRYVLDKIATHFGFDWEGDAYNETEMQNRLIDNSQTLDVLQYFIGDNKFAFWKQSFNLADLVPDITVVDFIKRIAVRYNLAVSYNEQSAKVSMRFREPLVKAKSFDDITSLSSPITDIEDLRITGYQLTVALEEKDVYSTVEIYKDAIPKEEIPIACGRIQRTASRVIDGLVISGPLTKRKNGEKFGLRVFNYAGIVSGKPVATIQGSYAEDITTIRNNFYAYWLLFAANRRQVMLNVDFELRHLLEFDWALKRRFDRKDFWVKSIKFRLTQSNVSSSEVELITLF
jgi:hypothetical protein